MKTALFSTALLLAIVSLDVHADETSRGQDVFQRRCTGCHALDGEKEGPRLRGVYGRKAASVPSFTYSDALKKAQITWNAESLDRWLTGPENVVPETDMAFRLTNAAERKEIIEYLKQISGHASASK